MLRFSLAALVSMAAAGMAGCASAMDSCDPREDRDLIAETDCIFSGRTEQFLAGQEEELQRLISARRLTEIEAREIEMDAARLAKDADAYAAEIAQQEKELNSLRGRLVEARNLNAPLEARKAVLIKEIDALNAELKAERQATNLSQANIVRLKSDIARRRTAIEAMSKPVLVE